MDEIFGAPPPWYLCRQLHEDMRRRSALEHCMRRYIENQRERYFHPSLPNGLQFPHRVTGIS
ncbi:MAG: hypothetical protein OJF51_004985 [Nitrospira sp.]|nr:MAG: hypothetical protein OJF51_004985 [Nitrospira sp.]